MQQGSCDSFGLKSFDICAISHIDLAEVPLVRNKNGPYKNKHQSTKEIQIASSLPTAAQKMSNNNAFRGMYRLYQKNKYTRQPPLPQATSTKPQQILKDNRGDIVNELIENERKFNTNMTSISRVLTSGLIKTKISTEDFQAIRLNLSDYIDVSFRILEAYLNSVRDAPNQDPAQACIAKYFLPLINDLQKEIIIFIKGFDPKLPDQRPHLKLYYSEVTMNLQKFDDSMVELTDRLRLGFQKPFHLSIIYDRLRKSTPESHPDYKATCDCYALLQKLLETAEEVKLADCEYNVLPIDTNLLIADSNLDTISISIDDRLMSHLKNLKRIVSFGEYISTWIGNKSNVVSDFIKYRRIFVECEKQFIGNIQRFADSNMNSNFINLSNFFNPGTFPLKNFNANCKALVCRLSRLDKQTERLDGMVTNIKIKFKDVQKFLKKNGPNKTMLLASYRNDELNAIKDMENSINWAQQIIECSLIYFYNLVANALKFTSSFHEGNLTNISLVKEGVDIHLTLDIERCINRIERSRTPEPDLPVQKRCVIKFPYTEYPECRKLVVGQIVNLVMNCDDGMWSVIKTAEGENAYFPTSYLQPIIE